ncbi:hypothetical protein ABE29_16025 [Cytobacillus firmus]|nr:hypothetical protein [Cytobacillus firmus]MBG9550576.1 hypothetical protein [Cytobacillus firmus]MBG9554383.1 hypothetical protein [Cytobacillus firmus]MBG9558617.1 hypothetical protein [Cytobacillus firmus]MBG9577258.1 hypothetical protein [Cytobacillus firmus]
MGRAELMKKIAELKPKVICFVGKGVYLLIPPEFPMAAFFCGCDPFHECFDIRIMHLIVQISQILPFYNHNYIKFRYQRYCY